MYYCLVIFISDSSPHCHVALELNIAGQPHFLNQIKKPHTQIDCQDHV